MSAFLIFAIALTTIYIIYYTVIILQDLYRKPQEKQETGEVLEVSDMEEELNDGMESIVVTESENGFSIGESNYETPYEEETSPTLDEEEPQEEKPSVLEKLQASCEEKMENTDVSFSDAMHYEELNKALIAKGMRPDRPNIVARPVIDNV
jgi:hypothetical protein